MKEKIELYFTRDFSLCTADFWHVMLSEDFKREFGVGIDKQIMRFNGRAIEAYREISEMERVKEYILDKGLSNPIFSQKSVQQFKDNIDKVLPLIDEVKGVDLQAMIDHFDESVQLFKIFYPWVAFSNFLPSRWENSLIEMYPEQAEILADRWYQARVFSEGKFEIVDAYWRELISKLLVKNNFDRNFSKFVRFNELKGLIIGRVNLSKKELLTRKEGYILYQGKLMVGKDLSEFLDENNFQYDNLNINKEITEIKGQVASLGRVIKGRVQVILNIDEVASFRRDNILVTTMTVPDFVPAMKKARAIITDEGGVTCHAAIVSRELKIPCVIGTKIATKVLKDGDKVEVDADKGIIRKLN